MRKFICIFLLLTLHIFAFAQTESVYDMKPDENFNWLIMLKQADKQTQLSMIKDRLIKQRRSLHPQSQSDVPILIIDGIPVPDDIHNDQKEFLITHLTAETVDIQVLDKEPEGLYINKEFSGIVLIGVEDRKVSRKFQRLRN